MDMLLPERGAFYVMDRAYLDFTRLFRLHQLGSFFVLRSKSNTTCEDFTPTLLTVAPMWSAIKPCGSLV